MRNIRVIRRRRFDIGPGQQAAHGKVMRTLYPFLQKDEVVMQRHRARLNPERDYQGESLLLSFDFARYVTELPV